MPALNFDSRKVEPIGGFTPLPKGEYIVLITASERKPTKKGDGEYLQLTYDVVEPVNFKGRKLFDRLNIINPNETAQDIAQRALSAICRSVGVEVPKTSEELHNIPFKVKVGINPAKGEYNESNKIDSYAPMVGKLDTKVVGAVAKKPATAPAAKPAAAPATAIAGVASSPVAVEEKMPWE
jgi:hypothetical protein